MVKIGDQIHAPFFMSLPPQDPEPFNMLFRALTSKLNKMPLRVCMTFGPDGMANMTFKSMLAQVLSFT